MSDKEPSTTPNCKGIAKTVDAIKELSQACNEEVKDLQRTFEDHQEAMSAQAYTYQMIFNGVNDKMKETNKNYECLTQKITKLAATVEAHAQLPLASGFLPCSEKNSLADQNSTRVIKAQSEVLRYSTTHPILYTMVHHRIMDCLDSKRHNAAKFKFDLSKPPNDRKNRKILSRYVKFYIKLYEKNSKEQSKFSYFFYSVLYLIFG
jgi:hypothetical protein